GLGPYLHRGPGRGWWAYALGGSQVSTPRPPVHPLCDSGDPAEAVLVEMRSRPHHLQDGGERLEVGAFRGDQWIRLEERHDDLDQLAPPLHREAKQRVAGVVVAPVLDDLPAPEHLLEEFERWSGRRGLGDRELVLDLPAEEAPGIAHDRDREA